MKDIELLENIRKEYLNAGEAKIPGKNIIRGTNHTISSIAEDLFAKYVSDIVGSKYEVWIDPQITIPNLRNETGKRALLFRPDVCIVQKKSLRINMLFDLKMDLGYKRKEFLNQVKHRVSKLNEIKKEKAKCSIKQNMELSFAKELIWNYIIISSGNISEKDMEPIANYFNNTKEVNIFKLSNGNHLNDNSDDFEIQLCKEDLKELKREIRENISTI